MLEPNFVFRPETPDYGIDGEVEEFDADDRATGLRYKVQLKSTDMKDLQQALSVRVPLSNANYWRAQDLPVLLVRYHRPSDQFFVRWFHAFDPYQGGVGQTGITFRWQEHDAWHEGRAEELAAEARAFLELRSSRIRLPFPFALEVADGCGDPSGPEIRIALRAAARARPDVVRLIEDHAAAGQGRLIVAPDRLIADLGGVTTATMHLTEGLPVGDAEQVALDLLSLAALAFERVGQADIAGRLASSYLAESNLIEHPEAPWALSAAMAQARQIDEALALADRIDQQPSDEDPALWFTLPVLYHSASLTEKERAHAIEVLSRRIDRRQERSDTLGGSRACVNLANFYRNRGEPLLSIPLYDRALELDAGYGNRRHYWEDKAGVLFGAHRYNEAADGYGRALELGAAGFVRALQADALLFAGRYEQAGTLWGRFVASEAVRARAAEYVIKLDLVTDIADVVGLAEQLRDSSELTVQLIPGDEPPAPTEAREIALAALRRDALDPRAWELLAWAALAEDDLATHARYTRAVAVLLEGDADTWARAVAVNHGVPGGALTPELLVTGERLTGGRVLPALAAFAREFVPAGERAAWLDELEQLVRAIPPDDDHGFAVRFLGEHDSVEEFAVAAAENGEE